MNNTEIYIIIGLVFVLMILAFWLVIRLIKRKKKKGLVPEDIMQDFNDIEKMYQDSNGTMSPQEVLWKFYQGKNQDKPLQEIKPEIKPEVKSETEIKQSNIKLFKRR